jgi:hypothetical protein
VRRIEKTERMKKSKVLNSLTEFLLNDLSTEINSDAASNWFSGQFSPTKQRTIDGL